MNDLDYFLINLIIIAVTSLTSVYGHANDTIASSYCG